MRVMSYNILDGGRDAQGLGRLETILQLVGAARPDLLVLSECNGFEREDAALLRRVEHALGMRGELAQASSGYHVALFSRGWQHRRVELLHEGFAHVALQVELARGDRMLQVLAAHLSPFNPEQRLREARSLTARLARDADTLVMGDLNSLSPRDRERYRPQQWPPRYRTRHCDAAGALDTRVLQTLEAAQLVDLAAQAGAAAMTRPSTHFAQPDRPAQRLDYILASVPLARRLRSCRVLDDARAQQASDHLPVLAELED